MSAKFLICTAVLLAVLWTTNAKPLEEESKMKAPLVSGPIPSDVLRKNPESLAPLQVSHQEKVVQGVVKREAQHHGGGHHGGGHHGGGHHGGGHHGGGHHGGGHHGGYGR